MCVLDFGGRSICIATPNISASRPLPVADPNNAAGDAPALQLSGKNTDSGKANALIFVPEIHIVGQPFPVVGPRETAGGAPALQFLSLRAVCKPERDE
jgi:hypothetical protein